MASSPNSHQGAHEEPCDGPKEILVVDDSRVQAKVLQNLLQRNSYAVRVAGDGVQALEMAREKKPCLIISDIVMPRMDGYQMCQALKGDLGLCDVPVVLLTALSDTQDIVLGLNARADSYLTKPYNADFLLSTVASVLEDASKPPRDEEGAAGIEVRMGVNTHLVTASRRQMLSLLLSTYGNAIEQNRALTQAQHQAQMLNEQLREQSARIEEQQKYLQEANARLQLLAIHDGLTGLKNHRAFKEKLEEEVHRSIRYQAPLSLLLIDVDSFKTFNDVFGHPAGDEVLRMVALLLQNHSRATDFVARYGGEEFAVLMPNTDLSWSIALAERLRSAIERAPWLQRPITASFGVSTFFATEVTEVTDTEPGATALDAQGVARKGALLLEESDRALYHSKRAGRNRVTHSTHAPADATPANAAPR